MPPEDECLKHARPVGSIKTCIIIVIGCNVRNYVRWLKINAFCMEIIWARSHRTIDEVCSPIFGDYLWLTGINEVCDESSSKKNCRNACCGELLNFQSSHFHYKIELENITSLFCLFLEMGTILNT